MYYMFYDEKRPPLIYASALQKSLLLYNFDLKLLDLSHHIHRCKNLKLCYKKPKINLKICIIKDSPFEPLPTKRCNLSFEILSLKKPASKSQKYSRFSTSGKMLRIRLSIVLSGKSNPSYKLYTWEIVFKLFSDIKIRIMWRNCECV